MLSSVWALSRSSTSSSSVDASSSWISKARSLTTTKQWKKAEWKESIQTATERRSLASIALQKQQLRRTMERTSMNKLHKRSMGYQIEPKKMRMETGAEAPCRRYYREENNPYSLKDFEILKKIIDREEKLDPEPFQGVKKLENDLEPIKVRESDDVLDPFPKPSWWSRPIWYRHATTIMASPIRRKLPAYLKDVFVFEGTKAKSHTIWSLINYGITVLKERAYSITPNRLSEVTSTLQKWQEENPFAANEDYSPFEKLIYDQITKFRIAFREDMKDFWRQYPPYEPWQVPLGLADPDPHIDLHPDTSFTILLRDLPMNSSAVEDTMFALRKLPSWRVMTKMKIYSTQPWLGLSSEPMLESTIKLREQERRSYQHRGSAHKGAMDIITEHLPGWNHATHTFHHGRRNTIMREIAEESEIMARYPEPMEERLRPSAIPKHIQSLFEWRAFPDPFYSHYAYIDPIENAKALTTFKLTGNLKEAHADLPERVRVRSDQGWHPKPRHWLYVSDPEKAFLIQKGTFPGALEALERDHLINSAIGSKDAVLRSPGLDDMIRESRTPLQTEDVMEALQQAADNVSFFQRNVFYNPLLSQASALWQYIVHGSPEDRQSSAISRAWELYRRSRSLPAEDRITIRRVMSEYIAEGRKAFAHKRESIKHSLGVTDAKLSFMHKYLSEKKQKKQQQQQYRQAKKTIDDLEKSLDGATDGDSSHSQPSGREHRDMLADFEALHSQTSRRTKSSSITPETVSSPPHKAKPHTGDLNKRSYSTIPTHSGHMTSPLTGTKRIITKPWNVLAVARSHERHFSSSTKSSQQDLFNSSQSKKSDLYSFLAHTHSRKVESQSESTSATAKMASGEKLQHILQTTNPKVFEDDLYALPKTYRALGSKPPTSNRRPPITDRESFFQARDRLANSEKSALNPKKDLFPSTLTLGKSFRQAVWGISKAVGRVFSNAIRNTVDRLTLRVPRSPIDTDMGTIIEWKAQEAREQFWSRFRDDFLSHQRSIHSRLPDLERTYALISQSMSLHSITGTANFHAIQDAQIRLDPTSFVLEYVMDQLIPSVNDELPGVNFEERWANSVEAWKLDAPQREEMEQLIEQSDRLVSNQPYASALRRTFGLYPASMDPSVAKTTLLADIAHALQQKSQEFQQSTNNAQLALEGLTPYMSRSEDGQIQISADMLWNDPKVKFHAPEAWKHLEEEYQVLASELHQNALEEMKRYGLSQLSDFEKMLFEVRPFIDRMIANPQDDRNRMFYLMKLEEIAASPLFATEWKPEDEEQSKWLHDFGSVDSERFIKDNLMADDYIGLPRKKVKFDLEPNSLSDALLHLGHPGTVQDELRYRAHIDYPFLHVKDDGTFVDMNADGEFDPLMQLGRTIASPSDRIHQQSAKSPFKNLKELLNEDPSFLVKAWIRTMSHIGYQNELRDLWKPLASDSELPAIIEQLKQRLEEVKSLEPKSNNTDGATKREYQTVRDLVEEMTNEVKKMRDMGLVPGNAKTTSPRSSHIPPSSLPSFSSPDYSSPSSSNTNTLNFDSSSFTLSSHAPNFTHFRSIDPLAESSMSRSEYYSFGSMLAALDTVDNKPDLTPPSFSEAYVEAAALPRSQIELPDLIDNMQKDQVLYESRVEKFIQSQKPQKEYSKVNPFLLMPYERIPDDRALSTTWKGTEPLILHGPLMPDHISTGILQYMLSLRTNLEDSERRARLHEWLLVRPELTPYIVKMTEYHDRYEKAILQGEPLPYGEDMQKTFFHWTISDFIQHYTTGYMEDLRIDRLMALSDLHILLFGNDSEKQLLRLHRRKLQRKALLDLRKQLMENPEFAESTSSCPTVIAPSIGSEEPASYTLLERIDNTIELLDKTAVADYPVLSDPYLTTSVPSAPLTGNPQFDASVMGEDYVESTPPDGSSFTRRSPPPNMAPATAKPPLPEEMEGELVLDVPVAPIGSPEYKLAKRMRNVFNRGELDDRYKGMTPQEAAIQRYLDDYTEPEFKPTPTIPSKARLPDEETNIDILKARYLQHPMVTPPSNPEAMSYVPKDLLPLAGLESSDWARPVSAQDLTLQRLHLKLFDPANKATRGNYPYDWADNGGPAEFDTFKPANKVSNVLTSKETLSMPDILKSSVLTDSEAFLAEQDEGVKLARRVGSEELIAEAIYLFGLRKADFNNHADERTIRLYEFIELKRRAGESYRLIPRRVLIPQAAQAMLSQRVSTELIRMQDTAQWARTKYVTWFGQDPNQSTFDLGTAFSPGNIVPTKTAASTQAINTPLYVPDPNTSWGPTCKSFSDLESEMRFQLALSVPEDVERILEEERTKFIADLEARLVAYKAIEKASWEHQKMVEQERLAKVEARLKHLEGKAQVQDAAAITTATTGAKDQEASEEEMLATTVSTTPALEEKPLPEAEKIVSEQSIEGEEQLLSILNDPEYLSNIRRELEALKAEREQLKSSVVEIEAEKVTGVEDKYVKLQASIKEWGDYQQRLKAKALAEQQAFEEQDLEEMEEMEEYEPIPAEQQKTKQKPSLPSQTQPEEADKTRTRESIEGPTETGKEETALTEVDTDTGLSSEFATDAPEAPIAVAAPTSVPGVGTTASVTTTDYRAAISAGQAVPLTPPYDIEIPDVPSTETSAAAAASSPGAFVDIYRPSKPPDEMRRESILGELKETQVEVEGKLLSSKEEVIVKTGRGRRSRRGGGEGNDHQGSWWTGVVPIGEYNSPENTYRSGRRKRRRFTPPRYNWRIAPGRLPNPFQAFWEKTYGHQVPKTLWNTLIAQNVQTVTAHILNGTPQCVRLNCHPDVIFQLEKFYQETFPKILPMGIESAFCMESRYGKREDGAYVSTSIWAMAVHYLTHYQPEIDNIYYRPSLSSVPITRQIFPGRVYVVIESSPERNFYVTTWSFDMHLPDYPEQIDPLRSYVPPEEILHRQQRDEEELKTTVPGFYSAEMVRDVMPKTEEQKAKEAEMAAREAEMAAREAEMSAKAAKANAEARPGPKDSNKS